MVKIRKSFERGFADHGWLKSAHTFSFADYYDPQNMGFSELRVINEDHIAGGTGFGTHPHRDMEIVTYIIEGELRHKDSMGNTEVIKPGEVQRMSAGTGVRHSEFNNSAEKKCHLLQIWIQPNKLGIEPGYDQRDYTANLEKGELVLTVSGNKADNVITMQQDAKIYAARVSSKNEFELPLSNKRSGWLQLISGSAKIGSQDIEPGDGVAISGETNPRLSIQNNAHFLFFDLPL